MKISHLDSKPPTGPAANERKSTATAAATASSGAGARSEASAKVALSSTAAHLVGPNDHVFDADKVARISNAIRDGKYTINADAIADKLIANARELVGQPHNKG